MRCNRVWLGQLMAGLFFLLLAPFYGVTPSSSVTGAFGLHLRLFRTRHIPRSPFKRSPPHDPWLQRSR